MGLEYIYYYLVVDDNDDAAVDDTDDDDDNQNLTATGVSQIVARVFDWIPQEILHSKANLRTKYGEQAVCLHFYAGELRQYSFVLTVS